MNERESDPTYLVLANSAAGSADRETVGSVLCTLAQHGSVVLRWTESVDQVPEAIGGHPRAIPVVIGGDGTISSSVDALLTAGLGHVPLGIVPSGTGNDFARAAGVPLDPQEAAEAVVRGSPAELSVLSVSGLSVSGLSGAPATDRSQRFGVNALHVGIGAAASRAASGWKARLGPAAYPLAAAITGARAPVSGICVEVDGVDVDGLDVEAVECEDAEREPEAVRNELQPSTTMVALVLGSSIGGGVELADSPSLDRSRAELLRATGDGLRDRIGLGRALLSSDPGSKPGITTARVKRLNIRSDRPVTVNLDGEDLGDQDSLEVNVVPGAWTMLREPRRLST